jgi:ribosomal protein S18 acetylase RimI-like enzyme
MEGVNMSIMITRITSATPNVVTSLNALLPQLSSSAEPLTLETLTAIVENENSYLLVATNEASQIVGTLTLATFQIPSGRRAWIEDVVVSESARGEGIGRQLVENAIDVAREIGAKSIDLTSRPAREAANALYVAVGFELRTTNVFRLNLS